MSSARLEVITDDAAVSPRMSRALAALHGVVDVTYLQAFYDKLDGLFDHFDAEERRRKNRFWWMYRSIIFWVIYLLLFAPMYFISIAHGYPDSFPVVSVLVCAIQIYAVWGGTSSRLKNGFRSYARN